MVVRVSKPSFFEIIWTEILIDEKPVCAAILKLLCHYRPLTYLFDHLTCDWFALAVNGSFCNNDNIKSGAAASCLKETEKTSEINIFLLRSGSL